MQKLREEDGMSNYREKAEQFLKTKLSLVPLNTNIFPPLHFKLNQQNALNHLLNTKRQLSAAELEFSYYQVVRDQESELYFSVEQSDYGEVELEGEKILFVTLEKTLGVIESNSNRLYVELILAQGLATADQDHEWYKKHLEFVGATYKELYADR